MVRSSSELSSESLPLSLSLESDSELELEALSAPPICCKLRNIIRLTGNVKGGANQSINHTPVPARRPLAPQTARPDHDGWASPDPWAGYCCYDCYG